MFKASMKKLIVRTSIVLGLATTATIATSQTADASVDMDKVKAAEKKSSTVQSQSQTSAPQTAVTVVRYGDNNETVRNIQQKLGISTDGNFGPQTERAVRQFQSNNGLQVDGVAGPQTQKALNATSGSTASTPSSNSTASANTSNASSSDSSSSSSASASNTVTEESQSKVAGTQVTNSSANSSGLVQSALNQIGAPYAWGGTSPSGFDCSGFINYVYNSQGQSIPRTAQGMYDSSAKTSNPNVGDVVFFTGTYNSSTYISHAGIYIGNGEFVHSGSRGVEKASLNSSYWSNHYVGAGSL
ncbi:cell wall-associated NlpC family hydrolase [Alkalihalobacillus xiaoxiensis]|uniref:Cell wall-associated NlpC family hydrolase n=1 Tax=Shouchella xiaoxiensis TaxID=766895 RepID=A0ABS2SZU5_9BACI|nr:NlpC/P60 family protein [Shouchella xiaoxiensis]MBM7841015.1 cell wall-associated NlpC family hydrolase [Shouchella xiaoxiensis]